MTVPPFFIVASARSGTTFLRLALNAHPEVAVPPESRFIVELYPESDRVDRDAYLEALAGHERFALWDLPLERVADRIEPGSVPYSVAIDATFSAYARDHGKRYWGDKTPRYVEHIPLLARLFPESRFIHPVRDGRNVALSYANVGFGPKSVAEAAELWARRVSAGIRAGRALPDDRYLQLRSEDLAEQPEANLEKICDFLGLDLHPSMFDENERKKGVVDKVTHNYDPKSAGRAGMSSWEESMRPRDVEVFEAIAGDLLSELGYPRRHPDPGLRARLRARLTTRRPI